MRGHYGKQCVSTSVRHGYLLLLGMWRTSNVDGGGFRHARSRSCSLKEHHRNINQERRVIRDLLHHVPNLRLRHHV